jgi:hypothetical protein
MMPRWPDCGKAVALTGKCMVDRSEGAAHGAEDRRPAVAIENGVEKKNPATTSTHCFQRGQVGFRMNCVQGFARS